MLDPDLACALAAGIHDEWTDDEQALLAPLIDAAIMRVDGERLEKIAQPVVEVLWDELQPLVAETLREQAASIDFVADALADALADLELGAEGSRLAVAVLHQAAMDLAEETFFLEVCLDCLEDGLERAPRAARPALVEQAAAVLALHGDAEFAADRPTDAERRAARARVRGLAALGADALPRLSRALAELAAEPLPPPREDRVLCAVVSRRLAAVADRN